MISKECQEALISLHKWKADIISQGETFNIDRARSTFKLASRPAEVVEAKTFRTNGVLYEWICDEAADPDRRLLYLHGGGFVLGDLDITEPFTQLISRITGCSVLAIDYHLAPEHPFPHALNDSAQAFKWLLNNGPHGPALAKKTVLAGDSAGGGLALSTLVKLRDEKNILPDCAFTLSAFTDLTLSGESLKTKAEVDPILTPDFLQYSSQAYASGSDTKNPYISPLYANLTDLPPLFMQVGESEILLDDTLRFAEKAKDSGVEVTLDVWLEMFHAWQMFADTVPEAKEALDRVGNFVKEILKEKDNDRKRDG